MTRRDRSLSREWGFEEPLRSRVGTGWLGHIGGILGFGAMPAQTLPLVTNSIGWLPALTLNASVAVWIAALAANASRDGSNYAVPLLYVAIAVLFTPIAARLVHPAASRAERIGLVLLATIALFLVRLIRAPINFVDHDEFLHWLTVTDIIEMGRLFTVNPLLPVSPLYPGLEIVTTAIIKMSGLSVFASALAVLATARLLFVAALYLFYERVTASPRTASIACPIYMGSSTFLVFDSHFSYESLAVVFLALALLSEAIATQHPARAWRTTLMLTVPFLAALSVTHHMTSFLGAVLLVASVILQTIRVDAGPGLRGLVVASCALGLPMAWSALMGNPTTGYLGPVFANGIHEVLKLFSSSSGSRELFVSADGSVAPAWQRLLTFASVGLICAGLATGFIRALMLAGLPAQLKLLLTFRGLRSWRNTWLIVLTGLTLAFPFSLLFRMTSSGWEIGNRVGPFSFFGVAVVVAVAIAGLWQGASSSRIRATVVGGICSIILIGGIISAEGPRILVPQQFQISADAASIEPMGIGAATWARDWLGPGNVFASDRINRLLLATHGSQSVVTTLRDPRDASVAIQAKTLGANEIALLRDTGVEYILSDLRLTTALPVVGVYFDGGGSDGSYASPLSAAALLKFSGAKTVSRPFDNGYEVVFDVRTLVRE